MRSLPLFTAIAVATFLGCGGESERATSRVVVPEREDAPEADDAPGQASNTTSADSATPEPEPVPMETTEQTTEPASESTAAVPMEPVPVPEDSSEETLPDESAAAEPAGAGPTGALPRLHGRITLDGPAPELTPLAAGAAAAVCNVPSVPNEAVVVGPDGGLANCIIFLKSVPDGVEIPPAPADPLVVDQKGCQFIPHVTFARVGQPVDYRNSDAFAHNVRSSPFRNSGFSTTAGPGGSIPFTYVQSESRPTQIKCDIHTFMTGWHMILDHPWCAITDEHGRFEISGLPEGELEFVAWHEKKGYIERSFTLQVDAGSDIERNYEVAASELAD